MTRISGLIASLLLIFTTGCLDQTAVLERRFERSFQVASGSTVRVELAGGSVTTETGPPGRVHVSVRQAVYTNDGESAANRLLADYLVDATQEGREVLIIVERRGVDLALCDSGDCLTQPHAFRRQVPRLHSEREVGRDP